MSTPLETLSTYLGISVAALLDRARELPSSDKNALAGHVYHLLNPAISTPSFGTDYIDGREADPLVIAVALSIKELTENGSIDAFNTTLRGGWQSRAAEWGERLAPKAIGKALCRFYDWQNHFDGFETLGSRSTTYAAHVATYPDMYRQIRSYPEMTFQIGDDGRIGKDLTGSWDEIHPHIVPAASGKIHLDETPLSPEERDSLFKILDLGPTAITDTDEGRSHYALLAAGYIMARFNVRADLALTHVMTRDSTLRMTEKDYRTLQKWSLEFHGGTTTQRRMT